MYCTKCGSKLPDNAVFCPNCGQKSSAYSENKNEEKDISDKIAEGINETVDTVSKKVTEEVKEISKDVTKGVDNISENVSSGLKNISNEANKKIDDAGESLKNFKISDILSKKYVDIGSIVSAVSPVLLMLLNFVLLTVLGRIFFGGLLSFLYYIDPVYYVISFIFRVISIIVSVCGYVFLAVAILTLGILLYRVIAYDDSDNMNIVQIISTVLSIVALFGFIIYKVRFLRWIGIITLLIGVDFIIISLIRKEEIGGNIALGDDFDSLKTKFAEIKSKNNEAKVENEKAKAAKQESTSSSINSEKVEPNTTIKADSNSESYFDGTGADLFVKQILLALLTIVTCGLATPYMLVKIKQWETTHTVINGKRLTFNGTATQLWGLWIKWWLLSLITCGIYTYFAKVDYYKWISKHTAYEGTQEVNAIYPDSRFEGNSFEYLGYSILTNIVTGITCGIAYSWMQCIMNKWYYKNKIVNSQRLNFSGEGGQLFGTYLVAGLLTVITCGIYSPWATCKINKAIISKVHVE